MGEFSKQISIYFSVFVGFLTFSLIFPFYPDMADDKGLPTWIVGVVFSMNPAASLVCAVNLGKHMNVIGRETCLMLSAIFISLSMFLLCPIQDVDVVSFLILSFTSRIFSGIGSGFLITTSITILTSDYPDRAQIMLGRMEVFAGTGLMVGPLIGEIIKYTDLFLGMIVMGGLSLILGFIAQKLIGELREYVIHQINLNRVSLFFKPVKST
jgi:MFS family permease